MTTGAWASRSSWVDTPPGRGPRLHKHPYEEVIIVQEGQGSYVLGDEATEVRAGEIVVIPADTPHKFVSAGSERLRAIDIHVSPRFSTEWLEE